MQNLKCKQAREECIKKKKKKTQSGAAGEVGNF